MGEQEKEEREEALEERDKEEGQEEREDSTEIEGGKGGILMKFRKVGERGALLSHVLLSREGSLGSPITFSKMDCKSLERARGFAGAKTFVGKVRAGEELTGRYEGGRPLSK